MHDHDFPTSSDDVSPWLLLGTFALFCFAVFVSYGASLRYGFLSFDDSYLIYNNLAAHGPTPSHVWKAFTTFDPELYIPVTLLSYQFNYLFAGLAGGFYHFTNLVLHAGNAALIFWVTSLITKNKRIALLAGAVFAVHPLNTEAAVWLAARKDLLSTFFYLGTLVAFLRYDGKNPRTYAVGIGLFILALLSKVSVLTLPLTLLILSFAKEGTGLKKRLLVLGPLFSLSTIFAVIAALAKARVIGSGTLMETILMACKSTVFYLQKFFIPTDLTPIYPYVKAITMSSPDFYIPLLIVVALATTLIVSLRWSRWPLIIGTIFLLTLAPSFLNFHKGASVFFAVDRYMYLPSLWLLLGLGIGLRSLAERGRGLAAKRATAVVVAVGVATLARMSMTQTTYWRDDETLFTHALSLYPESVSARMSLAAAYRERAEYDEEKRILTEGQAYGDSVSILTALGSVAVREGKPDEARNFYEKAMGIDPKNPESYFFMASLDEQQGNVDQALKNYLKASELDSSYVAAYNNAGAIYLDEDKLPEAEVQFKKAVLWNPNFLEGNYNVFQVLEMQNKADEAFPYLETAYELNQDVAEISIAYAYRLSERGRRSDALRVIDHALALEPNNQTAVRLKAFIENSAAKEVVKPAVPTAEERRQQRLEERQNP